MGEHGRLLEYSKRLYACLLRAYPAEYRREYGAAMAQTFGDLCRARFRERGAWGLCAVWLRVLGDTAVNAVHERGGVLAMLKTMLTSKLSSDAADRRFGLMFYVLSSQLVMPLVVHFTTKLGCSIDQMVSCIVLSCILQILLAYCGLALHYRDKSIEWFSRMLTARWFFAKPDLTLRQYAFFGACMVSLVLGVHLVDWLKLSEASC